MCDVYLFDGQLPVCELVLGEFFQNIFILVKTKLKNMQKVKGLGLWLLLFTLSGCGGLLGGPEGGSMSCEVDGDKFKANIAVVATWESDMLTVTGSGNIAEQCQIVIHNCSSEGTYEITASNTEANVGRWTESVDPSTGTYTTMGGLGSGTVEVTKLTEKTAKGTFSFTAQNTEGTEVSVTSGEFEADIQ